MAYDLRYPMITGASEKEQLIQMKSYLHQLVEQLNYSLNNIDTVQIKYISSPKSESSKKADDKGTQATFDDLKPLIIKSAEIVNSYYESINERLEGIYVAQSDFGRYAEQTSQEIIKNSTDITQNFANVQQIINSNIDLVSKEMGAIDNDLQGIKAGVEGDIIDLSNELGNLDSKIDGAKGSIESEIAKLKNTLDTLNISLIEVNANIKSGLLYYDDNEIPVYGLEIGQKNIVNGVEVFNKFARFSAGRLSFYDQNGTEVAYISDYKIYITHAEVTGTLKLGGYLVDTTKGVTFKWVGRS